MRRLFVAMIYLLAAQHAVAQSGTSAMRAGGAYDAVLINGLTFPLHDVDQLLASGVMQLNGPQHRFAFGPSVTSEHQLAVALRQLDLESPQAALDLYRSAKVALPNGAAHEITIPSGFGPARFANQPATTTLSASLGGVSRVPYTTKPDGGLGLGLSFGNAFHGVGSSVTMSFNDLSDLANPERISWGIVLSHYLGDGVSVALGGENLFVKVTDGEASFYLAGSWAFSPETSAMPFKGVMTLGAGSGRFASMTERDIFEGRTGPATTIFGDVAWEVNDKVNLMAEWNGRNLNAGVAYRMPRTGISLKLGVADLTGYSGDGPYLTGSVGVTLARF
ncbi:MAG: hypothetical protein ABI832_01005 [bacterium]